MKDENEFREKDLASKWIEGAEAWNARMDRRKAVVAASKAKKANKIIFLDMGLSGAGLDKFFTQSHGMGMAPSFPTSPCFDFRSPASHAGRPVRLEP